MNDTNIFNYVIPVLICLILVCWLNWLIFMMLVYLKSLMEKGKARI